MSDRPKLPSELRRDDGELSERIGDALRACVRTWTTGDGELRIARRYVEWEDKERLEVRVGEKGGDDSGVVTDDTELLANLLREAGL